MRTTQNLFPSVLLTEEQGIAVDEFFNLKYMFESEGFDENSYRQMEQHLNVKFKRAPNPSDVVWALYNEKLLKATDLHTQKMLCYTMALFLNREGKDHYPLLLKSNELELAIYKKNGVKSVNILCNSGCEACQKQQGQKITIEKALRHRLLPCRSCEYALYKGKKPFCRCIYLAEAIGIEDIEL